MTGEVTLLGDVLPVGGVKEKLLAAYRLGITKILLPRENRSDLEKIDEQIRAKLEITFLDNIELALQTVLVPSREAQVAV